MRKFRVSNNGPRNSVTSKRFKLVIVDPTGVGIRSQRLEIHFTMLTVYQPYVVSYSGLLSAISFKMIAIRECTRISAHIYELREMKDMSLVDRFCHT